MLAFKVQKGGVHHKFFESLLLSSFPILKNIRINTQYKNSTKSCLGKFSNKYENKLDEISER